MSVNELDLRCRAHLEPLWKPIDLLVNGDDDTDWSARHRVRTSSRPGNHVRNIDQTLESESCWKTSQATLRWDRRPKTQQPLRGGGSKKKSSSGGPQGWGASGKKQKKPLRPQIVKRQFTEFVYFLKDGASFLYLCNRKVPNSCDSSFFFFGFWNSCSRSEQCKKKKVCNLKLFWFVTYLCIK